MIRFVTNEAKVMEVIIRSLIKVHTSSGYGLPAFLPAGLPARVPAGPPARPPARLPACPGCGERPEERRYPGDAAMVAMAAAAAAAFFFVVGLAVGMAAVSPVMGMGWAAGLSAIPSAMCAASI